MCVRRYLGFVLLVLFPGTLHAQSAAQPCRAPRLNGGYLVPEQVFYPHETKLTYSCDNGFKPVVEGWWAMSTCLHGTWSHEPQCIDEKACFPPDIPNAQNIEHPSGWFKDGHKLRITCDEGYEHKGWDATAKCVNGSWSSVPICEKRVDACGEPPQIPHAVVIHREYQEVYPADTKVQYECEDGYTVEGADINKFIYCIFGNWTEGPTCSRGTRPDPGHGGGSSSSWTQPTQGVDHCGLYPIVPNGVIVVQDPMFLKYQCNAFYTQVGSDTVRCHTDGSWSQLPICKETFCALSPRDDLKLPGTEYIKEGESKFVFCKWTDYFSHVRCLDGRLFISQCCEDYYHRVGRCPLSAIG